MARTITTVTTTAKDKLPYHFICNYCGCRNDKVADIAGISVGGRENVGGALRDLHGEPAALPREDPRLRTAPARGQSPSQWEV